MPVWILLYCDHLITMSLTGRLIDNVKINYRYKLAIAMSEFSIFSFAPREDLALGRQSKAVLASRVNGKFLNEDMLDRLEQSRTSNGVSATDTKSTSSTIPSCIDLTATE